MQRVYILLLVTKLFFELNAIKKGLFKKSVYARMAYFSHA